MVERGLRGRGNGADLTNIQYKPICNCHNDSPHECTYPNKILMEKIKTKNIKDAF
jgi:hypothetical protein